MRIAEAAIKVNDSQSFDVRHGLGGLYDLQLLRLIFFRRELRGELGEAWVNWVAAFERYWRYMHGFRMWRAEFAGQNPEKIFFKNLDIGSTPMSLFSSLQFVAELESIQSTLLEIKNAIGLSDTPLKQIGSLQ